MPAGCHDVLLHYNMQSPRASTLLPCLPHGHTATPRVLSRRADLIEVIDVKVCSVGGSHERRKHVEATLRTLFCATPSGEWKMVVHHTRSGRGHHLIKGNKGKRSKTKRDICSLALARAEASASTPGIVVGDLNLTRQEVADALKSAAVHCESVGYWGGQGRFAE